MKNPNVKTRLLVYSIENEQELSDLETAVRGCALHESEDNVEIVILNHAICFKSSMNKDEILKKLIQEGGGARNWHLLSLEDDFDDVKNLMDSTIPFS